MEISPRSQNEPTSPSNKVNWLVEIADYLEAQTEAILVDWRKAVDADPRLEAASQLGKREFEDSISISLGLLCVQLRNHQGFTQDGSADRNPDSTWADRKEATLAHEHGFHRWQEGYDIQEVMFEWGHLHLCVVKVFNDFQIQHPQVAPQALNWSRVALAQIMNGGFSQSVAEYHRLQQTEAKEIVHSLSEALEQVTIWERQRGEVLREAVHDLRGNLTAVQAAASVLETAADGVTSTQSSIFSVLQRSTVTLQSMLTDLLDLARLEAGQETRDLLPTDIATVLRELCEANQPLAHTKGLELSWKGPNSLLIEADALKVRRIGQNLLLNAIKYTSQGSIEMEWMERAANQWSFSVKDTGPGLPAQIEDSTVLQAMVESQPPHNVPDPTSPPVHSPSLQPRSNSLAGEGVGLAIVKRLCTLLDAQLEVESAPGDGTTFRVILPRQYSTP